MSPILLIAALSIPSPVPQEGCPRGGKVRWGTDLAKALRDAPRLERPLLLYFTADW